MKCVLTAVFLLFLACRANESATPVADGSQTSPSMDATASTSRGNTPEQPAAARMIIRNASLSLIVSDAVEALRKVTALVEGRGGYIAETRQWKERERVRAVATLRVPVKELSSILAAIRGVAVRVESETVTGQDVSQEYSDLGAQLRNLAATETELRELLRTVRERTQKASEVMEVFREITKVRGEIEAIQGRLQQLSQMSALSTITLELVPDILAAPVVEPGWQPVATMKAASRALVNSLKSVANVLIWVTFYLLPLGLFFVALALVTRPLWVRVRSATRRPA